MPHICYKDKRFAARSLSIIEAANQIIEEYQADDMTLTLRQLYYQFVARDLVPNKQAEYDRIGSVISNARLTGLVDWNAIVDRTRNLKKLGHWTDPGDIIQSALYNYRLDHWKNQPTRIEVWIEKEALVGVISTICDNLDVPYFACRGYVSQSEVWAASQRFINAENEAITILHLGDHDPSGIDMSRDIEDRLEMFGAHNTSVHRIALNMDQVEQYNPPPNPAKMTDSRFVNYIRQYGDKSWELDALEPRVMRDLIEEEVLKNRIDDIYKAVLEEEQDHKKILGRIRDNWEEM